MFQNFVRVGLATGGILYGEKIVQERRTITAGQDGNADICFPVGAGVVFPAKHELFKLDEATGQYILQLPLDPVGRIGRNPNDVVEIQELIKTAKRFNGFYQIPLTDTAMGKLIIGVTSVLFQMVHVPVVRPKPRGLVHRMLGR